jgi:hypothetical protein
VRQIKVLGRPLITWSDVRWTLFIVAGLAFLYGVLVLSFTAMAVGGVWGWVIIVAALTVIVALIGRELWAAWLLFRRWWTGLRR